MLDIELMAHRDFNPERSPVKAERGSLYLQKLNVVISIFLLEQTCYYTILRCCNLYHT